MRADAEDLSYSETTSSRHASTRSTFVNAGDPNTFTGVMAR
jgi:hypothetical protein